MGYRRYQPTAWTAARLQRRHLYQFFQFLYEGSNLTVIVGNSKYIDLPCLYLQTNLCKFISDIRNILNMSHKLTEGALVRICGHVESLEEKAVTDLAGIGDVLVLSACWGRGRGPRGLSATD